MMYGWDGIGWGAGAWVAMIVMMLVFWGGVVTVVILLLRRTHPHQGPDPVRPPHFDAERILHERFARGEIDEPEFTARRSALRRQD
ncbi:SHOCT domain-containing protein [Arthrobacter cryoconiti]|uniref:SHOCT domain-containing protein n=1 Tax=Arthrobacter cryoconiti TaxID=748907 RepID=A0ABV8R3V8_9MICC|nr:SHOCT domain-containing protein [Arthrobacter cryoconiti]MCC9066765.1 SHOCT domain-containing protein [Arthrobacter cryoconiti]